MAHILTYSGILVPWDVEPRHILITDIAHALSMRVRYVGHCRKFYSVGEHSALVAGWVLETTGDKRKALAGLLHDAAEAYLSDMAGTYKPNLPDYTAAEARFNHAIFEAFPYADKSALDGIVKEADKRIMLDETAVLFPPEHLQRGFSFDPKLKPLGVNVKGLGSEKVKELFLNTFIELAG